MMKNMKIMAKLFGGFLLVAGIVLLMGYESYTLVGRLGGALSEISANRLPGISALRLLDTAMAEIDSAENALLYQASTKKMIDGCYERIAGSKKKIAEARRIYEPLSQTPEEASLWKQFDAAYRTWLENHEKYLGLTRTYWGKEPRDEALYAAMAKQALETNTALYESANTLVEKVIKTNDDTALNLYKQGQQLTEDSKRYSLLGMGVGTALCVLLGFFLSRAVTKPLEQEVRFVEAITQENYGVTLAIDQRDEIGLLAKSLRVMVAQLKEKLGFAQGVLNGITTPCCISDPAGNIMFINQNIIDLIEIGGTPKDFIGQTVGGFFYNEPDRRTISMRACVENKVMQVKNIELYSRKGKKIVCNIDASPISNLDNKVIAGIALVTDISEVVEQQHKAECAKSEGMLLAATNLESVVEIVGNASDELTARIEQSSRGAENQAQRVAETATAMEEMNATVLEVAKNASQSAHMAEQAKNKAQEGAGIVNQVVEGIGEVQTQALGLKTDMDSLGRQAAGIGQILNVISDIADQTNLLALNAAIEAARAGEAGRGFAVVADEVRKLAEKTQAATKEVGDAIRGIQDGTRKNVDNVDRAVKSIEQATGLATRSGEALGQIVRFIDAAADQVRSIAAASEQQSAASEEINRSIDEVSSISADTAQAMSQASSAVEELAVQAQVLRNLIVQMQSESGQAAPGATKALR